MRQITQLEYSIIHNRVSKLSKKMHKNNGYSFLYAVLDTLFPRCEEDIETLITDGANDRGADAIYIQEVGNTAHISIVQSKYANTIDNAKKNFPGNEVDKLISLVTDIADRSEHLSNTINPLVFSKIKDIWKIIDCGKSIEVRIYLTSNTLPLIEHEMTRLTSFSKQYEFVSVEELHFLEITNLFSSIERPSESGTLSCVDLQKYERSDCDIRGLVANIDISSYIEMISNENMSSIKRHVFDENIRGFLGIEGGFNKQILQSALSDENHLFWYLNNGITIICKDFTHQKVRGSKIQITDFQIVNGGQTSFSLFEAHKRDKDKVSDLVLLVKIFASSRDDISEKIAIATNSQARIAPRDLKSNDNIQKKISAALKDDGILYERKKHQFEYDFNSPTIDSLKLGQAILSYHLHEPHQARTSSDEIFGGLYQTIFSEKLDASYIVKLAKLFLFVNQKRELELDGLRRGGANEIDEFAAYTQWHLLYCISLLAEEQGLDVPEAPDEMEELLGRSKSIIGEIAKEHKAQSFYRVFRSAKTKELIREHLGIGQLNFNF
ncbi:AIPR family protein [uncultured Sneathiella sp.]|uniref:AIPR family protein n=1 Tax=uncultured Sneathiella sp. TaxID=879315 RepID=UPI0030D99940